MSDVLPPPRYPLGQLTSGELATRRKELEHAIKGISPDAPIQVELSRLLAEVAEEEESREKLAQAGRKHAGTNGV